MNGDRTVHVERKVIWNVVMINEWDGTTTVSEWPHDSESEAIARADRLFKKNLATIRAEDKL